MIERRRPEGQSVLCVGALLALAGCLESAWAQARPSGADAGGEPRDASVDARRWRIGPPPDAGVWWHSSIALRSDASVMAALLGSRNRDASGAFGEVRGDRVDDALGFGGLGLRGYLDAGGWTGEGTIGLGSMGAIGGHAGVGAAVGFGPTGRAFARSSVEVRAAVPSLEGAGVPLETVRRVVLRNLGAIRVCYERAGGADAGVLSTRVSFVIKPDGAVSDLPADLTIAGAPADLAQCVTTRFRYMVFPRPTDGSRVRVTYPFTFSASP